MIATAYIRDCIINPDKTRMIRDAIAAGTSQYGMQTFDQSLFDLLCAGLITYEEALECRAIPTISSCAWPVSPADQIPREKRCRQQWAAAGSGAVERQSSRSSDLQPCRCGLIWRKAGFFLSMSFLSSPLLR